MKVGSAAKRQQTGWRLARLFLQRDWRAGELRILLLSLIVAVAAISSVGFFTDRISQALTMQANELLGADLVLNSTREIAFEVADQAQALGLQVSQTVSFPSMLSVGDKFHLSMVKAVDVAYPLRGTLYTAPAAFAPEQPTSTIPPVGTVWLEPRLMTALSVKVGDQVSLGEVTFIVDAVLTTEPGGGGDLLNIAPRTLFNRADLLRTQLIQSGSRVNYQLSMAGDNEAVRRFREQRQNNLSLGENLMSIRDARPELRVALERAEQFLGLAALTSVILAGVAIALAARRFAQRRLDQCAILRCLGASQSLIFNAYSVQIVLLGVIGSALGCLIGFGAHWVLVGVLGGLLEVELPAPTMLPVLTGALMGMVTLCGFALPPLLQLKQVPALRVLRRDLGRLKAPGILVYGLGIMSISALMLLQTQEIKLGFYMIIGSLVAIGLLAIVAVLLLRLLQVLSHARQGLDLWRLGLANLYRRFSTSVVQVVAFGLGIMALLLLTVLRGDLLEAWQASIPEDTPNRFIVNIQADQQAAVKAFFQENDLTLPTLHPLIRGRLVAINGEAKQPGDFANEQAQRLVGREFNLTWAADLAPDNELMVGPWWRVEDHGSALISVDESMIKNLQLKIGDELTYDVAGQRFSATISNVRKVDWGSFRANFYVIAVPGLLDDFPTTYMTSFYLPIEQSQLLNRLVKAFPNITVIDVAAIMGHVRDIIHRVTLAIEYVFGFTLLAGLMVLYAGIQATHDERLFETAILRTLGGRRRQINRVVSVEFISLGALSGLLAAIIATVLAYLLAERVFQISYTLSPWLWGVGIFGGAFGVWLAGFSGTRDVLKHPPLQTLKRFC